MAGSLKCRQGYVCQGRIKVQCNKSENERGRQLRRPRFSKAHRFNGGQIDVPGHNPTRRDGLAHYRALASDGQAHSQMRPGVQRWIHARGMIARERILKRRHHGHQRLKPPQSVSRLQRRAIRSLSLTYLLRFYCPNYENDNGLHLFKLGHC